MKRIIYLATLLTLAACSSDEVVDVNQNDSQYITYDIITNSATRALDTHTASSKVPFKVSAIYTPAEGSTSAPNFYFKNDEMTVSGSTYTYTYGRRIWPDATSSLDFYAWHDDNDYDNSNSSAYPGVTKYTGPTISYVSGDDDNTFNNQVAMSITGYNSSPTNNSDDILYAVSTGRTKGDDGVVPINFRHALSQINFTIANAENSNLLVEIANISLCGIHMQGDFYCGTSTTTNYTGEAANDAEATTVSTTSRSDEDGTTDGTTDGTGDETGDGTTDDNDTDATVEEDPTNYKYATDCYWKTTDTNDHEMPSKIYGQFSEDDIFNAKGAARVYMPGTTSNEDDFPTQFMIIPQAFETGEYNSADNAWSGVYLKLSCCIYSLVNSSCLDNYKDKVHSDISYYVLSQVLAGIDPEGNTAQHTPWGIPVYVGDRYQLEDDLAVYNPIDLYIPLQAIHNSLHETVGWQAGMKYNYTITFGGDENIATDSTGNYVFVPISIDFIPDDIDTENVSSN